MHKPSNATSRPSAKTGASLILALVAVFALNPSVADAARANGHAAHVSTANGPPTNLVPWDLSAERKSLVEEIGRREERNDPGNWPRPAQTSPSLNLSPLPSQPKPHSNRGGDRLHLGQVETPMGSFSLVSRELDEFGRVNDVDFLSFDDPNSNWDLKVKVRNGAMFRISRKWGSGGGPAPFAAAHKSAFLDGQD